MAKKLFKVRVITNARQGQVLDLGGGVLKVKVTTPPVEGKANKELIRLLAERFGVKKRNVIIVAGLRRRDKIVEIIT